MEQTPHREGLGCLVGHGSYVEAFVLGNYDEAVAVAHHLTVQDIENAIESGNDLVSVRRVLDTVPVYRLAPTVPVPPPGPAELRALARLDDPDPERVVAGDVVRGEVANLLPRGTAIVFEPPEGRRAMHHGLIHLTEEGNRWGSPDDPTGRDRITESAWFLVLYVPGR